MAMAPFYSRQAASTGHELLATLVYKQCQYISSRVVFSSPEERALGTVEIVKLDATSSLSCMTALLVMILAQIEVSIYKSGRIPVDTSVFVQR